jgi:CubicO group peptidase (beta-lactamase class C family)
MAANGKASRSFRSNGFGDAPGRWWPRAWTLSVSLVCPRRGPQLVAPGGQLLALGLGGQALSVIPSHGLVIVAMSDNRKGGNSRMAIPDAVVNAVLELDAVVSAES